MKTLGLAFRNLQRQKRRTILALSALIVGVTGLGLFEGYVTGLMDGFRARTIEQGLGHFQIAATKDAFGEGIYQPWGKSIPGEAAWLAKIRNIEGIGASFPAQGFTAIAASAQESATILVQAFPAEYANFALDQPGQGPQTGFQLGTLQEGRGLAVSPPDSLILHPTMARILKVVPGDVITLMAIMPKGGLNGRDFTLVGISETMDKVFAYVDMAGARSLTGLSDSPRLVVMAKEGTDLLALQRDLETQLPPGAVIKPWQDMASFYVQVNTMYLSFLTVIRMIILLITLFILANTMQRLVHERSRELGTLRCLGTSKVGIAGLLLSEGVMLGSAGAVLGLALSLVSSAVLNFFGGLPYQGEGGTIMIHLVQRLDLAWGTLWPVMVCSALASIVPAWSALKQSPAAALRVV